MTRPALLEAERVHQFAFELLRQLLDRAADCCTSTIANDGLVPLFDCGHSRILCEEMTPRQGCLAGWRALFELALTLVEGGWSVCKGRVARNEPAPMATRER
jgi:uncharacterized phosphosugar-binding protein